MPMRFTKKDALTIYRLLEESVPAYGLSVHGTKTWRKNKGEMMGRIEKYLAAKDVRKGSAK